MFKNCVVFLCLFFLCAAGWAQVTTGTILGTVTDETGAVLPGVEVTVRNLDTGVIRLAVTDDEGRYRAFNLSLGNYEVQASLASFQTAIRTGIKLTVGREAIVDFQLRVGEISEQVVVQGEAPLVESTSSTITGLVDDQQIRDLPLNGRSFTQLAALQEGVLSPANFETAQPGNEGQKLSVGGTRITQTAFLLDGVDIRNHFGTTPGSVAGVLLGVDTVREFSVITSAASAEYGGFTGGVVNAVSRSGTNELHGSVFEFHRNSALDARNFFDKGEDPLPFRRNQFGFTLGGPIVRDKTFFFGSYEGLRDRLTMTSFAQVPDAAARQGVLPTRSGLPPLEIPDRVQDFLQYYPLPNGRNFMDGTGEYSFAEPIPTDEDYFMIKVDHNFFESDTLSVRYQLDDGEKSSLSEIPTFAELRLSRAQYASIEEKHIFSPSVINEFRVGFNRSKSVSDSEPLVAVDESLKYLPLPDRNFGAMSATGYTGWGPSALTKLDQILNRFEFTDNVIYTTGRHSLKFGVKITRNQFNLRNGVFADGLYIFRSLEAFLTARPLFVIAVLGDIQPEEDLPAPYIRGVAGPLIRQGLRETMVGLFAQDDFQWRKNLTLNLGLRYEFMTNPTEVAGRISNLDEPTDATLRVGNPLLARNASLKSFGPRLGVSWDPLGDGKMSVRAGAGIFYDFLEPPRLLGPQAQPPFFTRVTPLFPDFPNFFDSVTPQLIAASPGIFVYQTPQQSYVAQYHLTVQREILPRIVVTVAYQGTRGIKLGRLLDANVAPHQVVDGRYFWPAGSQRANPNFAQMRMYMWDGNSFFNSLRLGLQKRFSSGFQFQSSYTFSRSVDEASNTANFDTGGAASNGIMNSPFDHKLDRGLSGFDIRHNYFFNATLELPFGPGRALGSDVKGVAGKLISGWQLSGILRLSTGPPVNIRVGDNRSRSQAGPDVQERPDLAPGASNNPVLGGADQYFDPQAFVLQDPGFYGNVGRNTLIGPGIANLDFSMVKDTSLSEGVNLEFRAELFNVFNHTNLFRPASTVFSSGRRLGNAGQITETTSSSRQVQFALKLVF